MAESSGPNYHKFYKNVRLHPCTNYNKLKHIQDLGSRTFKNYKKRINCDIKICKWGISLCPLEKYRNVGMIWQNYPRCQKNWLIQDDEYKISEDRFTKIANQEATEF